MADLVERYVHQVGRYLPPKERAEIEAELRSQIQDQLEDRFGGAASQEEIASALAEFGHPYTMAASYSREKYLVGPILYPYMMLVMRYVWVLIPSLVVFLNLFGALISPPVDWLNVLIQTVLTGAQGTLIVSALVVLFFALIQHSYLKINPDDEFKPMDLPEVDDPTHVDRYEAAFGSVFGAFVILFWLYFLYMGGLALPFIFNNPENVIPVPANWLILITLASAAMIAMNLYALRRGRWGSLPYLIETLLELFGAICLYFVIFEPIFQRVLLSMPNLAGLPLPELLVILTATPIMVGRVPKLIKLPGYRRADSPPASKTAG